MTELDKIQVEVLESVIEDIQGIHPEHIEEFLKEKVDIIKNGI